MAKSPKHYVEVEMSGLYTWKGEAPRSIVYEGVSLQGVVKEPELPGFCVYYGNRPRLKAIGDDFDRAITKGIGAVEVLLTVRLGTRGKSNQSWGHFAEAAGDLLDLRRGRVSAQKILPPLRAKFGEDVLEKLAIHPLRIREIATQFPEIKAFAWYVEKLDKSVIPLCWIRNRDIIVSAHTLSAPIDVKLPPASSKYWKR